MINIINDNKKNIKYQGKNLTQNCDIIKLKTKQIFAKKRHLRVYAMLLHFSPYICIKQTCKIGVQQFGLKY